MTLKHVLAGLAAISLTLSALAQGAGFRQEFPPSMPPAHDPVVISCDGTWYLFCTGFGVHVFTSSDLVNWHFSGRVFDNPPQWPLQAATSSFSTAMTGNSSTTPTSSYVPSAGKTAGPP